MKREILASIETMFETVHGIGTVQGIGTDIWTAVEICDCVAMGWTPGTANVCL